ncbi:hypothetical protein ACPV4Z_17120 [Vibrio aestuarianus]|uniref:hypothetical protein n=1 Tax=Vibrio aestuarianus TaxID=28171 RepID=UPI004067C94C
MKHKMIVTYSTLSMAICACLALGFEVYTTGGQTEVDSLELESVDSKDIIAAIKTVNNQSAGQTIFLVDFRNSTNENEYISDIRIVCQVSAEQGITYAPLSMSVDGVQNKRDSFELQARTKSMAKINTISIQGQETCNPYQVTWTNLARDRLSGIAVEIPSEAAFANVGF